MSSLIGKNAISTEYPGYVGEIRAYYPDTGQLGIRFFKHEYVIVHISTCKLVVVVPEREYKELMKRVECR